MATVAVGDVHGNYPALEDLLRRIERELSADDTVVFLGDYVDRGPYVKDCVDLVLGLRQNARFEIRQPGCLVLAGDLMGGHGDDVTIEKAQRGEAEKILHILRELELPVLDIMSKPP